MSLAGRRRSCQVTTDLLRTFAVVFAGRLHASNLAGKGDRRPGRPPGGRRQFGMHTKRSWARRCLAGVAAAVAVAATAVSVSAATGPPSNTTRPSIGGTPVVGKILTAHNGVWGGTTPITYQYQWTRCSSSGAGCTSIGEASQSQQYVLTSDDL